MPRRHQTAVLSTFNLPGWEGGNVGMTIKDDVLDCFLEHTVSENTFNETCTDLLLQSHFPHYVDPHMLTWRGCHLLPCLREPSVLDQPSMQSNNSRSQTQ